MELSILKDILETEIDINITIGEIRNIISKMMKLPFRLVTISYKGIQLKENFRTLKSYGITNIDDKVTVNTGVF